MSSRPCCVCKTASTAGLCLKIVLLSGMGLWEGPCQEFGEHGLHSCVTYSLQIGGSSTARFRPLGCSLFFPSPHNGSPSILSSLGTPTQAHSLGESTFDWSRADAAPQQRSHGNHCQGDRALLCSSVSNFTEARMVPNLPSLCFACPKSPCSVCFVCRPPRCKTHGKQDNG